MSSYASIQEVPASAGRYAVTAPITRDLSGMPINLSALVIRGSQPGPTLTLLSGLHGNEWLHLTFFRRLYENLSPQAVRGTVVMVPIANTVAFGSLSRAVRDDSDNPDANRVFPGKGRQHTWIAEQVATTVANEVLAHSDYLLDFHLGIWGSTLGSSIVGSDYSNDTITQRSLELSYAFGTPLIFTTRIVSGFPGPRSSQGYAGEVLQIPCSGSMLGGAGFDRQLEAEWQEGNLRGIRNVMIHTGMLEGEMRLPESYLTYETVQRVNPRMGGLLVPLRDEDTFGRAVEKDEVFGHVICPLTFETIETLRAPMDGYLAYWARSYPVRPGDWAFAVIPKDHPGTRWVSRSSLKLNGPAA